MLGDSIGAGYGLAEQDSWAAQLAKHLSDQQLELVNASVSGETSAGGLRRLPALLERHQPRLVILELGGNDGLRGYPIQQLRRNLAQMISAAHDQAAQVYLLGMRIPPNYGPVYTERFHRLYAELAEEYGTALAPFLLEGVGDRAELMQNDGIHPNAAAQGLILNTVLADWPDVRSCASVD